MINKIRKSDVIITDGRKLAIGIKYDSKICGTPQITGKWKKTFIKKIFNLAEKHDVFISENIKLARELNFYCDVMDCIPEVLFDPVAKILAKAYRIKGIRVK